MRGKEEGRTTAKSWFRQQVEEHKGWVDKVISRWKRESSTNNELAQDFVIQFIGLYNRIASSIRIKPIEAKSKNKNK